MKHQNISVTGSLNLNGVGVATTSTLNAFTASSDTKVNALIANTGSYATTGSNTFTGSQIIQGTLTAQTLVVQTVTSSVLYTTGSNIIGSSLSNIQQITGSVGITGSLAINGTGAVVGSGTANYVPKFTAGSTVGSSLIYDDGTNIGIGITPSAGVGNLQIGGTANASLFTQQGTDTVRFGVRASGRSGISIDSSNATYTNRMWYIDNNGANGSLYIGRSGLDVLTLANTGAATFSSSVTATNLYSSGNSGIGTSNAQSITNGISLTIGDLATQHQPYLAFRRNSTGGYWAGISWYDQTTRKSFIEENSDFDLRFGTSNTLRMIVTSAGNVGIGTSSPSQILDVRKATASGNTQFNFLNSQNSSAGNTSVTSTIYLGFCDDGGGEANANKIISGKSGDYTSQANANSFLAFATTGANASTERMRITSGGNLQIGGTTATNATLYVKGSVNTSANFAVVINNSTPGDLFFIRNDGFINTGMQSVSPYNNPTSGRTMVIESGGGLGYTSSTRESKTNINSISNVDWINSLNPVSFNYRKKDNNRNYTEEFYNEVSYGFIADEVEKVNKELVFYNTDNKLAGVEYNSMIAILTKAIQELSAENTSLINRIEALENK